MLHISERNVSGKLKQHDPAWEILSIVDSQERHSIVLTSGTGQKKVQCCPEREREGEGGIHLECFFESNTWIDRSMNLSTRMEQVTVDKTLICCFQTEIHVEYQKGLGCAGPSSHFVVHGLFSFLFLLVFQGKPTQNQLERKPLKFFLFNFFFQHFGNQDVGKGKWVESGEEMDNFILEEWGTKGRERRGTGEILLLF